MKPYEQEIDFSVDVEAAFAVHHSTLTALAKLARLNAGDSNTKTKAGFKRFRAWHTMARTLQDCADLALEDVQSIAASRLILEQAQAAQAAQPNPAG